MITSSISLRTFHQYKGLKKAEKLTGGEINAKAQMIKTYGLTPDLQCKYDVMRSNVDKLHAKIQKPLIDQFAKLTGRNYQAARMFWQRNKDMVLEFIEEDDGGYEEVWGAKVWCSALTTKSDCCNDL